MDDLFSGSSLLWLAVATVVFYLCLLRARRQPYATSAGRTKNNNNAANTTTSNNTNTSSTAAATAATSGSIGAALSRGRPGEALSWDCRCFLSSNIYVDEVGGVAIRRHLELPAEAEDGSHSTEDRTALRAAAFRRQHGVLLATLTRAQQDELVRVVFAEVERRRSEPARSALRAHLIPKQLLPHDDSAYRINPEVDLHPCLRRLVALAREYLQEDKHPRHASFARWVVSLAETAAETAVVDDDDGSGNRRLTSNSNRSGSSGGSDLDLLAFDVLGEDIYSFPVLSRSFCERFNAELNYVQRVLPPELHGRVNSMNRSGFLLHELGFTEGVSDPLVYTYVQPLATALFGREYDHLSAHRAFTVHYGEGEDASLSTHYDNAEVTLNINIDNAFKGGELSFLGPVGGPERKPPCRAAFTQAGWAVLHLGRELHRVEPVTAGRRRNLVFWVKSAEYRQRHGCPLCGKPEELYS
eukprot:m.127473 g.127473  ORF g.127473 m.127473 type:complete len:470 (+) comp16366_c1_seq1:1379-2788(+)